MDKISMGDFIDSVLYEKPIKKAPKEIKESDIDVQAILEAGQEVTPAAAPAPANAPAAAPAGPQDVTPGATAPQPQGSAAEPIPEPVKKDKDGKSEEDKIQEIKDTIEAAKKAVKGHQPKGDVVLNLSMALQNNDIGKIEIGEDEYPTITNFNIIFNKFGINYKQMPDSVKSFKLAAEETISQSDHRSVSIMVEMVDEETFGIQVFVDDTGLRFDDLTKAIQEFDRQYGTNILDTINKKVRA